MSFHDQARQPADTLSEHATPDLECAVRACLDNVLEAAARERAAAVEAAVAATRAESDAATREAIAAARAEMTSELEVAVASARAEVAEQLEAAVSQTREAAREEVEACALTAARDEARRELDLALAEAREAALAEQERAVDDARAAAAAETEAALAQLRAEHADAIERMRQELESSREATDDTERRADSALASAVAPAVDSAGEAAAEESQAAEASTEALRDAIVRLDETTSLSECLDALADAVSQQAGRSMVFVIRGHALRAWRLAGFEEGSTTAAAISVPLDMAGDLWQVAERGRARDVHPQVFGRETDPVLAFARLDDGPSGIAVPLCVAGKAVALVYADGGASARAGARRWAEVVEILARHASRCLEVLTATRSAGVVAFPSPAANGSRATATPGADAQVFAHVPAAEPATVSDLEAATAAERYARLLVSEVKLYNEAAVRVARHKRDIRVRLRAEIERARRLYHDRIPPSLATRDEIFESELVRVLADGQPELLGGSDMPEAV